MYTPKRPKVEGNPEIDASVRRVTKELATNIQRFELSINPGYCNNSNQKTLRDLKFAIDDTTARLGLTLAMVNKYLDIRNQQGRKGRGKKKSPDSRPNEKEKEESKIKRLESSMN